MSVSLVVARCGAQPKLFGDVSDLREAEQDRLLDPIEMKGTAWLHRPLADGKIAVGRRDGPRCTWWIVGEDFALQPPAAIWQEPAIFAATQEAEIPVSLDVEALWKTLSAQGESARWIRLLAALVEVVRAGDEPVVVKTGATDEELLALSLLLIHCAREPVSLSLGHPIPDPGDELVFHSEAVPGRLLIDAESPPEVSSILLTDVMVRGLLDFAEDVDPTADLVLAIQATYPRSAPIGPYCAALLEWMRRAEEPRFFSEPIEAALLTCSSPHTDAARSSIWTEVVRIFVQREAYEAAEAAVVGPIAEALIDDGASVSVAMLWSLIPEDHRSRRVFEQLVSRFSLVEDGDQAAAVLLYHALGDAAEVDLLISRWVSARGIQEDEVCRVLRDHELCDVWIETALESLGVESSRWFHHLHTLPIGPTTLESIGLRFFEQALAHAEFPDSTMSRTARMFVEVDGGARIWPWVAITAASPDDFPDEVIDATVVDYLWMPPQSPELRKLSILCARRLGAAEGWTPLDHARWIVRIALVSTPPSVFAEAVLVGLVGGLTGRSDAAPHVAQVVLEMFALGPEHLANVGLFTRWLPAAWAQLPKSFVATVQGHGVPVSMRTLWKDLISAYG